MKTLIAIPVGLVGLVAFTLGAVLLGVSGACGAAIDRLRGVK